MATSGRGVDVATAVLLGLVSVATALGAWQASVWNTTAAELKRDADDALDVSVNTAVLAEFDRRYDTEASAQSVQWSSERDAILDPLEQSLVDLRIQSRLASTTPGFSDAWYAWRAGGYVADQSPLLDPMYLVARDGPTATYAYISRQLADAAGIVQSKSDMLARAALVHALALFLFGISSVGRLQAIRYGLLALGTAAFAFGLLLWILAY